MDMIDKDILRGYQKEAEEMGISLTDYLLFKVLIKLDDLSVTTYSGEE